jgi:hypothetical protein
VHEHHFEHGALLVLDRMRARPYPACVLDAAFELADVVADRRDLDRLAGQRAPQPGADAAADQLRIGQHVVLIEHEGIQLGSGVDAPQRFPGLVDAQRPAVRGKDLKAGRGLAEQFAVAQLLADGGTGVGRHVSRIDGAW